jgi:hypothetical protein
VYEESLATGAFKRVSAASTMLAVVTGALAARRRGGASAALAADDAREALSQPVERAATLGAMYAQGLLTGMLLGVVVLMGTYGSDAALAVALSSSVAPLRLALYVLAMVAWLGSADLVLSCRALILESAAAGNALAAAPAVVSVRSLRPALLALSCHTVVVATVFATMAMESRLRANGATPSADLLQRDLQPWRALVLLRFAAALAGWLVSCYLSFRPSDVDKWIGRSLAVGGSSLGIGGAAGGGGSGLASHVSPAALAAAASSVDTAQLAALPDAALDALAAHIADALAQVEMVQQTRRGGAFIAVGTHPHRDAGGHPPPGPGTGSLSAGGPSAASLGTAAAPLTARS